MTISYQTILSALLLLRFHCHFWFHWTEFTPFCCIIVLSGIWQTQTDESYYDSSSKAGVMIVPNNGSSCHLSAEVGCWTWMWCTCRNCKTYWYCGEILDNDIFFFYSFAFLLAMVFFFKPYLLTLDLWLFEKATLQSYMLRSDIECHGELGFSRNFSYFKSYTW